MAEVTRVVFVGLYVVTIIDSGVMVGFYSIYYQRNAQSKLVTGKVNVR